MANKRREKRSRTIYYFRASYTGMDDFVVEHSLEHMVKESWKRLPSSSDRTFLAGNNKNSVGMKLNDAKAPLRVGDEECTLISIGLYEAGASANTIPQPSKLDMEMDVDIHDAPMYQEYLDGEGFACLYGNHIILSPTDTFRHAKISDFINNVISKGGFKNEALHLDIQQIADIDTLNTIQRDGIKSILVNAGAYLASYDYIKRVNPEYQITGFASRLYRMAASALDPLKDDDDPQAILDNENLSTRFVINHNGKIKSANSAIGADRLKEAAASLVNTELSGYAIITKTDKTITHDEIVLRNKVQVKEHGKSVDREDMWNKLLDVLVKYDRDKILEN